MAWSSPNFAAWAWTTGALWYANIPFPPARMFLATLYGLGVPAAYFIYRKRKKAVLLLFLGSVAAFGTYASIRPSNNRLWRPNLETLPWASIDGDRVTVHDIRNTRYETEDVYEVRHYDKTFRLDRLVRVWFVVVPFEEEALGAHTFVSFEFEGDEFLAVSIEVRREKGEEYSLTGGLYRQFEIMYVVADERDVIGMRAVYRKDVIYLYPIRNADREMTRAFFLGIIETMNRLHERPEFYNTITRNCTTALVSHVNDLVPGRIPLGVEIMLPGLMDQLLYRLGRIDTDLPLEEARQAARIEEKAIRYADDPEFSKRIRGR